MWTRLKFPLCLLLIGIQSSGLFASGQTRRPPTTRAQGGDVTTGLQVRLSEGTAALDNQPVAPAAPAARLSDDDAQRVLRRLKPLAAAPSDEQDFALRDRSLPPPRAGKVISDTFPPTENLSSPDSVASGPLE